MAASSPSSRRLALVHTTAVVVAVATALAVAGLLLFDRGGRQPLAAEGACRTPGDAASVARVWNEVALDAIRRDIPAPTVHARNLYHLSAAMWDAWAAFDADALGLFTTSKATTFQDGDAARIDAISLAGHRILTQRYRNAEGRDETLAAVDDTLGRLCGSGIDADDLPPESAAAFGVELADAVLDASFEDGSLEGLGYEDISYRPVNEPLIVVEAGAEMDDPNRWQPLSLEVAYTQNGLAVPVGEQEFIGPNWGYVAPFAIPTGDTAGLPLDPGPPPLLGTDTDLEFREAVLEVIRASSRLQPDGSSVIDVSPGAHGNNTLGADDGTGHPLNPVTGEPYEANPVDEGDYGRVIAEYWADGPESETPPGHWNLLANEVSDIMATDGLRLFASGPEIDRLEWDVKLYLTLNGALHDAAVAAWGAKAHYDYVRPISMIRYAAGLGQSSDPDEPSYHPSGLLLEPGLVEVVTDESAADGERHAHLVEHVGDVAIRAWRGTPVDPETQAAGVGWILGVEWVPYQRPTFVTPSFAGYVSGHSTFSRAGAEVLAAVTGSPFFPGGMATWTVSGLLHESGLSAPVTLQWATYFDAADEAGRSRIYGGIHVRADDHAGRRMGAECGQAAIERAQQLFR